jgi:hypothetical protein
MQKALIAQMQAEFSRADIERILGDAVVYQAWRMDGKAPMVS